MSDDILHYRRALARWSGDLNFTYDGLQLAALMAILDELKRLNSLLHCPNFIRIPRDLQAIKRNTTKKKRKPKA